MISSLKKKTKLDPTLLKVLCFSFLLHVIFAFIAGVVTVATYVIQEDQVFDAPPLIEEEKPQPKIKIEVKPRNATLTQPLKNLRMREVGNIAVVDLNVDLPGMGESFTVGAGLGGVGGGNFFTGSRGSLNFGLSDISVFGIKTRAERILFMIDANRRMVTDAKGGLNSYRVIKDEVCDMIGNLSAGTLFNVIVYDHRRIVKFKPNLLAAGSKSHMELVEWIGRINSNASRPGLEGVSGSVQPKLTAYRDNEIQRHIEWSHGANDTAYITQVAIEQNADTIFLIAGYHRGFGDLVAPPSQKRLSEWQALQSSADYLAQVALYEKEVPQMMKRIDKKLAGINADRSKKGLPPRVLNKKRQDVRGNARELELEWTNPHPTGGPGHEDLGPRIAPKYFKALLEHRFTDRGKQAPSLNVILFLAGDEEYRSDWSDALKKYVRLFRGRSRVIRGANEIKSARSASKLQKQS